MFLLGISALSSSCYCLVELIFISRLDFRSLTTILTLQSTVADKFGPRIQTMRIVSSRQTVSSKEANKDTF